MAQVQGTKEQILVSAYNSGVEYIHNYQKNNADFYNELVNRFENEKLAMQILGFSPVGWLYYLGKGLYNGAVGFAEGAVVTLTNFINNVVQVFKSDEQFGSKAWRDELVGDINYLFVSGLVDALQGLENATLNFLGNAGGMFGASTEWSENLKEHSNKAFYDFKVNLLKSGSKNDLMSSDFLPSDSPDRPENHTLPFASDIISGVDDIASKMYWKDDIFAPYMQDNEAMSKAHQLESGVSESIGRMIPSIALTYLSGGSSIGILASSSYFYATTYGQSFNEAIEKGVSIYDANQYATQIAMVETMTEQIGGFQFGSGIGSNIAESVVNEGMEEFIAEMATSQVTYDEEGKPIYESQDDLIERVLMATFSGAISGGLMTGGQIFGTKVYRGEVGKTADNLAKSVSLSIKQNGLDKVQSAVTNALDDAIESLNKTVNNEQSRKKSEKIISETEAQKYIEYSEKEKKFVLTDFGEQIKKDIRAHQGKTAMTDNHAVRVNPTIKIKEEISVERIENGKKIIVKEKIKILEKNNPKYKKDKKSFDNILDTSEELGINVVLYDGDVSNAQGFYVDGVSYVNINVLGKDGLGLQKQIYGHELLHQLYARFRQNVLTEKADKKLMKLTKDILESLKTNKEFVKEVGLKTADIKDLATLREEHLAYFIEKYISMDLVMERLAYRRPDLMKNIVDDMTSIRAKREMTVIEKEYMELLAEINLHTMDSISATLALSNLTPENAKASKIVQRKMYNKTKSEYDYLVNYLIKVDKNGEYIVPDELKEDFKGKSDKDVKFHPDFKAFLVAFKNRDEKAIIDNFLNTKNIEDETLQKRLTAYKAVQIFEYMESNKFYRHNEVMEAFKADFVAEINSRIEAKKATLKDFPVHDGNLIKVDAETFHEVFALNYLKMWRENYVSLYPISTYKNVKYLYLRDDLMAGFAVQGEETNDNADFGRYELASLFRSEGEAGWLKGKVDFIVKDLQARQLSSVSERHARRYKEIFEGSLQIIRNSMIKNEEKPMRFKNFGYSMLYMSNDWTALYSNYIITELALRKDNPTYKTVHQTGLRRRITTPIKYSKANVLVTDSEGRELTPEQQEFFKDSKFKNEKGNLLSLYHGSNSAGFMQFNEDKPIFLTDDFEHSITYTRGSRNVITQKFNTLESLEDFIVSDDFAEYFPFFEDNQDGRPTFAKIKNTPEKSYMDEYANTIINDFIKDRVKKYGSSYESKIRQAIELNKENLYITKFSFNINNETHTDYALFSNEAQLLDGLLQSFQSSYNYYLNEYDQLYEEQNSATNIYSLYARVTNPLIIDCNNRGFGKINFRGKLMNTDEISQIVKDEKVYDGIIFERVIDNGFRDVLRQMGTNTVYVVFNSNQLKAIDNETPTDISDIRYSRQDYTIRSQFDYFQDTLLKDKNGSIVPMLLLSDLVKSNPTYYAKSLGVVKSGYFLFSTDVDVKKYKKDTKLVFANITKALNADVKITSAMYENIIKNAVKKVKTLDQDIIDRYRLKIISGEINNFSQIVDMMSFSLSGYEDLYNFKRAIFEATGYDGFISYDENGNIVNAVAWFDEQIKSVDNLALDDNQKDIILFSKYSDDIVDDLEEVSLGDIRVKIDIEKLLKYGWLKIVADKSLLEKGYMFQIPKSNFYIHERHLKIPFPFEKNNIFYASIENEMVLYLKNLKTNEDFELSIPQDYIHPTTKKIYKNARYLASGMSYHWLSRIPTETGSISQSVALEDLSSRVPEASSFSSEKPGKCFPKIFVVMKKDILNKTDTISGSIDYFTKVRKIYGDKIMLFDDFGNASKEQFREMVKKEALSEIEKNKGVISEKIEQDYNIYDENDPLIVEKINNAQNKYLKARMVSKIADFVSSSYNKSSYTNQYRMLSILRDLVFFGKTNLNFVSDANRTFDFISEIDKYSNMVSYLANRYENIEIMAQNIFDATSKKPDEYNMKEYLLKLPYAYIGHFAEVRELKTNIKYSDIATVYYKYGNRDYFAIEQDLYDYDKEEVMEDNDTYGEMRKFDNAVNEIEKTLSDIDGKGIRIVELDHTENIHKKFIEDINNGDLDPDAILFSKQDISENIYESGLVDNNSSDFIDNAVLFSRKFVKVKSGDTKSALNNLHSQKMKTFDRKTYENIERVYADFLLTYKEDKKTTGGKVIAKIVENIEKRIRNNNNREQIFNHLYNTVAKTLVLQLNILNSDTTTKTTDAQREILVSSINSTIAQTMSYLDTVFTNNDVNKLDPSNTQGNQYTRLIYHYLRAVLDNNNQTHEGSEKITSLYEALFDLDITSKTSLEGLYDALKEFEKATNVDQVSSCVVATGGEYAHTIKNAERQADIWIDSALDIVGKYTTVYDKLGKRSTKRSGGLIGKNSFLDDLGIANWIADPFTYAEIASLFLPNALPQVIQNRLFEGSKKQLKVLNHFHTFFEEGGWAKHNQKNINNLEKKYIKINNLLDYNGNPMDISLSQVITLYNTLKRELIRNKMIDEQFIKGEKTHHFENGNRILATENVNNKIEREAKGRYGKIVDNIGLLNDLSEILHQPENSFAIEYNKKIMSFFEAMYPYVNATFKDINGLELPNDAVVIKKAFDSMNAEEKSELLDGFPTVEDFSQIYIPYRNARGSYSGKNTFDVNNILDLGVFDGLAQALTNSSSELVIDSINNLMPEYSKEVANYYGLYRIARDLNEMFGTQEQVPGTIQETNLAQKMVLLSPNIVKYYEELLKDIAGYSTQKDTTSQKFDKFMAKLRKNYFRASLALNAKVIATQFASLITCGTIFGKGNNPLTNAGFMARFMKNLFTAGSKTRAKYLVENSEIYKNRARLSTYEVSEATEKIWTKNPIENAVEFLMRGITITDNMINRALFITLVEDGYSEQEAMEKVELAISRYQSSGNAIDRAELLRTENQILRLFTKFLGEPMKMLTNFYGISKKLNIINKYEKNKDEIIKHFDNKKIDEDKKLIVKKEEMRLRYEYEASPAFQALSEKDKRKYTAETQKKQSAYNALEYEVDRAKRMYDIVKSNVQEVINSKAETKEKLGRLVSAFAGSLLWQVLLGVAFKMLRGGAKDKPEDEEMWAYIGKMFGFQLATELVGYLPFVRDVYTVVINGYSGHEIDELQPFNDLFLQMNYLISDIANGGDFNAGRHIRQFSISLGSILGIPARNIERLFTTPMSWFSQSSSFTYKSATGQRVDVNQELTNAIANQDEKLIEAVIAQKLNSRNIMLGQDVIDEVERLASVNGEMITISGDYGKFTVDGKEYVLTREQQEKFTEIYSRADYIASKIIKSAEYKQLSDEYKAKFLTSIFNYFYKMAKQEISGIEQISEKNYFTNLADAYDYFITAVAKRLYNTMINEQEKKEA
ncbi:MAG TPA: hypothetical protein PK557_05250 [Paludibacteraceae bacterium]|nr:hypothetical protein [Paludibacteraceae bacterium]